MKLSMILALVGICAAITVALYVGYARRRARRRPVGEQVIGPHDGGDDVIGESTTSAQTETPVEVKDNAGKPSIEPVSPPPGGHFAATTPEVEDDAKDAALPLVPAPGTPAETPRPVPPATEPTQPVEKQCDTGVASDETTSVAATDVPHQIQPSQESPTEGQETVPVVTESTEKRENEAAPQEEARQRRERAPVSPEDRGGRSRETTPKNEGGGEKKRRTRTPKPEIVCWKRQREWILAVELPDGFPRDQSVMVVQNGKPLEKDETENGCWRLALLHGEVVVRVVDAENERLFKLPLGDAGCLIFKLSGDDRGRHVKSPSSGSCLAVVPEDWKRDEALAGAPRIAPEGVCLLGYRAHFFEL